MKILICDKTEKEAIEQMRAAGLTVDVRDDPLTPSGKMYWRLMWAFGQHQRMWNEAEIRTRLERHARERGML